MTYSTTSALTPLLTADEEVALARRVEAGMAAQARIDQGRARSDDPEIAQDGLEARRQFVQANLRLAISIANKMKAPAHVDRQDLVQDGMVGLDKAVTRFDWRKGYKFSTYATWWIRQSIQRGLENTASTVRIPAHRSSELRVALAETDGDAVALSPRLRSVAALTTFDSIDRPFGESTTIGDLTPSATPEPEAEVETREDRRIAAELLSRLDEPSAAAVAARFGLDGTEPATYTTIAARLGVSPEAVRRRVKRALVELRPLAESLGSITDTPAAPVAA